MENSDKEERRGGRKGYFIEKIPSRENWESILLRTAGDRENIHFNHPCQGVESWSIIVCIWQALPHMSKEKPSDGEPEVLAVIPSNGYRILNVKTIERWHQQHLLKVAKYLLSHEVIEGSTLAKWWSTPEKRHCMQETEDATQEKGEEFPLGWWYMETKMVTRQQPAKNWGNQWTPGQISSWTQSWYAILSDVFHHRRLRKLRETLNINKG